MIFCASYPLHFSFPFAFHEHPVLVYEDDNKFALGDVHLFHFPSLRKWIQQRVMIPRLICLGILCDNVGNINQAVCYHVSIFFKFECTKPSQFLDNNLLQILKSCVRTYVKHCGVILIRRMCRIKNEANNKKLVDILRTCIHIVIDL